jgi:hypothetical protein
MSILSGRSRRSSIQPRLIDGEFQPVPRTRGDLEVVRKTVKRIGAELTARGKRRERCPGQSPLR